MHLFRQARFPSPPADPRRGSALITVTIVSAVVILLVGSILSYALTERRLNLRHAARLEARNAAAHSGTTDRDTATHWRNRLVGVGCEGDLVALARTRVKK